MSKGDIATRTGYSERHLQRVLPQIPGIQAVRQGRKIIYSVVMMAAAAAASSSSSTTTIMPAPLEGQNAAECPELGHEPGQMSIVDISGNVQHGQVGHFRKKIKADEPPNRERVARRHRETPGAPKVPTCTDCTGENANKCRSCPLSYAELERDTIQFVIVDQEFRDRLVEEATLKQWRRKTDRGLTWIYQKHLTLQVGGDVVVFYSDEPEDLGHIVNWVREHFSGIYQDVGSLVARIRRPHEITRDELTVIVTDPDTQEAMRPTLERRMDKTKTFYLRSPNPNIPGLKGYYFQNTLRIEFDCRDDVRRISALYMRRRLMEIIPDIAKAPGLFDEYLTDYYNPYEHPIIIDTGVDAMMQRMTDLAETLTDKFTAALHDFTQARTVQAQLPEVDAITGDLDRGDDQSIDAMVKAIATHLKVERKAAMVYMTAFSLWSRDGKQRHRVNREDIGVELSKQDESLSLPDIATAIVQLQKAGLMENHHGYDVWFTSAGATLGNKLIARWRME